MLFRNYFFKCKVKVREGASLALIKRWAELRGNGK